MTRHDASDRARPCQISGQCSPSHNPLTGVLRFLSLLYGTPPHDWDWRLLLADSSFPATCPLFSWKPWQRLVGKSDYGADGSGRNTIFTQQERTSLPWPPPQHWMGFSGAGCGSIEACREVKARGKADKWVEMAQMVALIMMMMNLHLEKRRGYFVSSIVSELLWKEDKHFTINHH